MASQTQEDLQIRGRLVLQGVSGGHSDVFINSLMVKISGTLGINFTRATTSMPQRPHEWIESRDYQGRWNGCVDFVCQSAPELALIFSRVHGTGVEVDGIAQTLEVESLQVDFAQVGAVNIQLPSASPTYAGNGFGGRLDPATTAGVPHPPLPCP